MTYQVSDEQIRALEADARRLHHNDVHTFVRELWWRPAFQEILRATAEQHWDSGALAMMTPGAGTTVPAALRANPNRRAASA